MLSAIDTADRLMLLKVVSLPFIVERLTTVTRLILDSRPQFLMSTPIILFLQ